MNHSEGGDWSGWNKYVFRVHRSSGCNTSIFWDAFGDSQDVFQFVFNMCWVFCGKRNSKHWGSELREPGTKSNVSMPSREIQKFREPWTLRFLDVLANGIHHPLVQNRQESISSWPFGINYLSNCRTLMGVLCLFWKSERFKKMIFHKYPESTRTKHPTNWFSINTKNPRRLKLLDKW